jgi:hypothetical protein
MPEPIIFNRALKDEYVDLVCRMWKVPTTPAETIENALSPDWHKLVHHPLSNIHMQYVIFMRAAWTEAVLYGLADAEVKHKALLRLRESFREIQRWPEAWQEAIAPVFAHWAEVLREEERQLEVGHA